MKRACIFVFALLIFTGGITAHADSLPQPAEFIYCSGAATDEVVEDNQINLGAVFAFLIPLFITIVGGSTLYILKRRRGEKVKFFNE